MSQIKKIGQIRFRLDDVRRNRFNQIDQTDKMARWMDGRIVREGQIGTGWARQGQIDYMDYIGCTDYKDHVGQIPLHQVLVQAQFHVELDQIRWDNMRQDETR